MLPPPPARRDPVVDDWHGTEVPDPYRWLEDADSPDVREWVTAQNERTRQALDARPDRGQWHERLVALMQAPVVGTVQARGPWVFTLERPAGAEQLCLLRRSAGDLHGPGTVLLDPSTWAADAASAIDWFEASPSGRLIAFGRSDGGDEDSVLHVLDTTSGTLLADRIEHSRAASVAWLPDESGFYSTRYPADSQYERRVFLHRLGGDPTGDELVWGALPTPESWPDVSIAPDGRHLLVHVLVGWGHVEVHLGDTLEHRWSEVVVGEEAVTELRFGGDGLIGVTTLGASRGRIVTADLGAPSHDRWRTVVPETTGVRGRFVVRGEEVVSVVTERAVDRIERHRIADGTLLAPLADLGVASVVSMDSDADAAGSAAAVHIVVSSFSAPPSLVTLGGEAHRAPQAPAADLVVRQVHLTSADGTVVGMFLVHAAGREPGPDTPTILNGYGGFAISETPVWSPHVAAWCAAGGLYALAGLRGGYEEGEAWHHAGRRGNKQNVFDDFRAAGDWLVEQGLTSRERLGIFGGSNGGLLVGAALTQWPDAWRAVWCAVPLLDMVRFPQFLIARLWTDEYGDPDVPEEFGWLHAYSPYHRVVSGVRYPAVLLTTAEGDTRVDPLHARKMAASLQFATAADDRPILLHQESRAGHGVGKPVAKRADEYADALAFLAWQLGGP